MIDGISEDPMPPYRVVKGCLKAGFKRPEDTRWVFVGISTEEMPEVNTTCICIKAQAGWMPEKTDVNTKSYEIVKMKRYVFSETRKDSHGEHATGKKLPYYIGQCNACFKIYWMSVL